MAVIDELRAMQVFYVNIGGGEPTIRADFYDLVDYAVGNGVGVKFSTNGSTITAERAERLAGTDYVDVQISVDGATAATNDVGARQRLATRWRGGRWTTWPPPASVRSRSASSSPGRTWPNSTRSQALADSYGAELRLTRLRPSGRGADTWDALHPTADQQIDLYRWLQAHPNTLTGDSFFHLVALGDPLPGLNLCGAGRVVCLIDPIGDVYACPFVLHPEFRAGSVRDEGGFTAVWRASELFAVAARTTGGGRVRVVRLV